jgi:hypothetical protein
MLTRHLPLDDIGGVDGSQVFRDDILGFLLS